jgi:protein FAM50
VKKAKKKEKSKLSFAGDEEEEFQPPKRPRAVEEGEASRRHGLWRDEDGPVRKFTKNPNVDTSFLPDRQREERERLEREELRKEWLAKQERMKLEDVEITYSYWDGSGHRKAVEVRVTLDTLTGVVQERR